MALPVGQGDAFYLERNGKSILVDGGKGRKNFSTLFTKHTKKDSVDILACTHNDADHANGVLGFLESGLECGEVWLPKFWLDVLPAILKPFHEFLPPIAKEINGISDMFFANEQQNTLEQLSLEKYTIDSGNELNLQGEPEQIEKDGWTKSTASILEEAGEWRYELYNHEFHLLFYHRLLKSPEKLNLLSSAIEAADRIRNIALAAYGSGIPVRWFEFSSGKISSIGTNILEPLNAKEVTYLRPSNQSILKALALTVANKESLVFWAPKRGDLPGVLFTADSDLENTYLPNESDFQNALVTSPHHGSESNYTAYCKVNTAAGENSNTITWIRSDCKSRKRPGATFRQQTRRYCTLCNYSTHQKQTIKLTLSGGAWIPNCCIKCSC